MSETTRTTTQAIGKKRYQGSCACGKVKFEADLDFAFPRARQQSLAGLIEQFEEVDGFPVGPVEREFDLHAAAFRN